jgi:pimeloyl-ACP methyl ester carboxylesterase
MRITIEDKSYYVGTGGKPFDSELPTVVFLHGTGMDHRAWALQTRWFAFHGYNVLAPDFPGHSLSEGKCPESIEDSAVWLEQMLDHLKVAAAHIVGHSQGFLSALEFAANSPKRVISLVGVGTAAAIPVNPALIKTAYESAFDAAKMMLQWGFGPNIHLGVSPTPGMQPLGQGLQIMGLNPIATDLEACAAYTGGAAATVKVSQLEATIPTAMILAGKDKMTPIKSGYAAATTLNAKVVVIENAGHMLHIEAPREVLDALRGFITELT